MKLKIVLDKNPKDSWALFWLLNYFYIQKNKTAVQMNTRVSQQGGDTEKAPASKMFLIFFFLKLLYYSVGNPIRSF